MNTNMGMWQTKLGPLRNITEQESGEMFLWFDNGRIMLQNEDRRYLEDWFGKPTKLEKQKEIW